jgi:hypothetical protein
MRPIERLQPMLVEEVASNLSDADPLDPRIARIDGPRQLAASAPAIDDRVRDRQHARGRAK